MDHAKQEQVVYD